MREPNLRERNKQRARQEIADAAFELFAERGFEQVTIAEVAHAAGVSEATVYNHFPTKEDLIYGPMQSFEANLLDAVQQRPPGQSALDAVRSYLLSTRGLLANPDPAAHARLLALTRMVTNSPALLAKERQLYDEATAALALLIAAETSSQGNDIEAWVVANALTGVHRALVAHVRRRLLAGTDTRRLAADVHRKTEHALDLLAHGLNQQRRP